MKLLKVIHGWPMRYNAGSEVYSQMLCHQLANRHEVHVFTREEDPFAPDFRLRVEPDESQPDITLHIVNNPRLKDRYRATAIDRHFAAVLDQVQPDLIHVGHLNHLSTSMLGVAHRRGIPIVYTLHDYWLMCPRGQFVQMLTDDLNDKNGETTPWALCDGQNDAKCARHCYARYFSGAADEDEADMAYWTSWVTRRMAHVREMANTVAMFIAPSRYLHDRFRDEFGIPADRLTYLDYGFDLKRLKGRPQPSSAQSGKPFTFGYIGRHVPVKGIQHLIKAFESVTGEARLRIWGRAQDQSTTALQTLALANNFANTTTRRIEWMPEYRNDVISQDVFDHIDALIVPSIWMENSPLVIHEAQQVRLPVITANAGGMAEYVRHEVNGLLFDHRSPTALAAQMQRFIDDPLLAEHLGKRGYLFSDDGNVISIATHAAEIETLYEKIHGQHRASGSSNTSTLKDQITAELMSRDIYHDEIQQQNTYAKGPWRITFDTNPDLCNLRCIMCEEHSVHSPLQEQRKAEGRPRRVMPFELIERVVTDAAAEGLQEIIPSTMGEPLLYDDFDKIIDLCGRFNIRLNLTTNGTFPRRGARAWAERIVPVASDVKISWNGATSTTQEAIMIGSRWDKVVANVREFVQMRDAHAADGGNRASVTFQLTFLETNVGELADIVRLAIDLGIDRIKGHHLWAHFAEINNLSMRRNSDAIHRWNTAVCEARSVATEHLLANGQQIQLDNIFELDIDASADIAPGGVCPFLGQEAWVSATGRFDPCCAPDAQRRELGTFGNLHDTSLMEIWTSPAYQKLMKTYQDHPLCRSCNMRKPLDAQA